MALFGFIVALIIAGGILVWSLALNWMVLLMTGRPSGGFIVVHLICIAALWLIVKNAPFEIVLH